MGTPATAVGIRHNLPARILEARKRTDELFALVREEAIYDRPIPQRHRILFYLGHVEAFDWNLLAQRAFGLKPRQRTFDDLFAFGIDPVGGGLPTDKPEDWPARKDIEEYNERTRNALDTAIQNALAHPGEGHPQLVEMLEVAIEHRLMHAETLTYMLHRLPTERKIAAPMPTQEKPRDETRQMVEIPAGTATLGLEKKQPEQFGWDNEFGSVQKQVPTFAIEGTNVTNREFLRFVQAGGYQNDALWSEEAREWLKAEKIDYPAFWRCDGNIWMYRTMFGEIRLPRNWPVYVSHAEASAYAEWLGRKLPSEEQFHRAAYGTPDGTGERSYPWGEEPPDASRGNFDFASWNPTAVGTHEAGASAFGVQDLVGNGWEWTRTAFEPLPGFMAMPFYPTYSANFFDGKHYVMKGGSQRTAACMLRRSFRNWFQPHYPYVYAAFRCVEE